MRWLFALLLLTGVAFAQSQKESVRPRENFQAQRPSESAGEVKSNPPQTQPRRTEQPTAADQHGTEQAPLSIQILPPVDAKEQAEKNERERIEKKTIDEKLAFETQRIADYTNRLTLFTCFLAVIATLQALLFGVQLTFMRGDIQRTKEAFIATHRPLLAVKFVEIVPLEERVSITFGVINVGLSNATVLGSSVNAEFLPDTSWPNPHSYPQNNLIGPRRFVPGATDRYMIPGELKSLIEIYADGLQQLRFYGYIVYRDDLGHTRTTFFCRIYDRDMDRFNPVDRPDYESTD